MAYVLIIIVIRLITVTRVLPGAGCSMCAWVGLLMRHEPCNCKVLLLYWGIIVDYYA